MRAEKELKDLDRTTETIFRRLANWRPEELELASTGGGWTALEIIAHLCQVERAFAHFVRRTSGSGKTVLFGERIRARVVIGIMRLPVRVKVPPGTPVEERPKGQQTLAEARSEWLEIRAQLRSVLTQPLVDRSEAVFRHPVSGWMNMDLAVGFLAAHCRHHLYQIERLRRSLKMDAQRAL